ncbi:MAG: L-histidine N(alpha)-methyltransferase [Bryobacterales bacterium]|nr:L-histidine N(alpha)-methyltransferase [Bryobacterales bacterium]
MPTTTIDSFTAVETFARDVRVGLSRAQKEIPSQYLYDDLGAALFDAITHLPEYGLTRADERLLLGYAQDMLAAMERRPAIVAELGSGSGRKTRAILEAAAPVRYYPIDISTAALRRCVREMNEVAGVNAEGLALSYLDGLSAAVARRKNYEPLLLLFLGSTIGNFDRKGAEAFLAAIRSRLLPGDALLLGADLIKPVDCMIEAYDDPTGVTAAFNRNVAGRLNRELGADFDLRLLRHEARYNAVHRRIEMHLVSLAEQTVEIPAAGLRVMLREEETIWTEASHKFAPGEIAAMAEATGFQCAAEWVDDEWPFSESLLRVHG